MTKRTRIIFLFLITILLAGCAQSTSSISNKVISSPTITQTEPESEIDSHISIDNSYIPYKTGILNTLTNKRRILFFYANWCPTCIPADKEFLEESQNFPSDVVLIRVNYNDEETDQEEKMLAQKYAITYQHSFVEIDSKGDEVKKWNGGRLKELLLQLQ